MTETKLIPLADKIVIKPILQDEMLASGIVIPETAKEKPVEGEVIAVGPGRLNADDTVRIPVDLRVGDRLLFGKYTGQQIKIDQEDYIILSEKEVLCRLEVITDA